MGGEAEADKNSIMRGHFQLRYHMATSEMLPSLGQLLHQISDVPETSNRLSKSHDINFQNQGEMSVIDPPIHV